MKRSEVNPLSLHSLDPSNNSGVLLFSLFFFYLYFMQVLSFHDFTIYHTEETV